MFPLDNAGPLLYTEGMATGMRPMARQLAPMGANMEDPPTITDHPIFEPLNRVRRPRVSSATCSLIGRRIPLCARLTGDGGSNRVATPPASEPTSSAD